MSVIDTYWKVSLVGYYPCDVGDVRGMPIGQYFDNCIHHIHGHYAIHRLYERPRIKF